MATLRSTVMGNEISLMLRNLVGRAKRADIRLAGEGASKEHATINWNGDAWILHDSSRNGTRVNGRLLMGERSRLTDGDQIVFGDPAERWQLTDASAPEASATCSDGRRVSALNGVLLLPNDEEPIASLYSRNGRWELDVHGEVSLAEDDQLIRVGDCDYRLQLPTLDASLGRTVTSLSDHSISSASIILEASADEEHVSVWLQSGSNKQKLPDRTLNYMLLVLARARQQDVSNGVASDDAGWVYADDLARQLDVHMERLNVDVHRARRAAGRLRVGTIPLFVDADRIIERRRTTTQIRLGVAQIRL